jgi:hypothetical protein
VTRLINPLTNPNPVSVTNTRDNIYYLHIFRNLIIFSSNLHSCLVRCIYSISRVFTVALYLGIWLGQHYRKSHAPILLNAVSMNQYGVQINYSSRRAICSWTCYPAVNPHCGIVMRETGLQPLVKSEEIRVKSLIQRHLSLLWKTLLGF